MKRLSCLSLRSIGLSIASFDVVCALSMLSLCSAYLYEYYVQVWQLQEGIRVQNPLANYLAAVVDYLTLHSFSNEFYLIICISLWVKSLINLVMASLLIDGVRKKRLLCMAPWLINTIISILIETTVFVFTEIKIGEVDLSLERRIARCIIFGIFLILNAVFSFGIFSVYNMLKEANNENRALQESIVEATGLFQHVKV